MNRRTREVFLTVNVEKDIAPHLVESTQTRHIYWAGPFDRHNRAPIGDTDCGLRFPPIQTLALLYEISLRPHLPALQVAATFTTPAGGLMKAGSPSPILPRDVTPWARRFGILGPSGLVIATGLPTWVGPLSKETKRRIRLIHAAGERLKGELSGEAAHSR